MLDRPTLGRQLAVLASLALLAGIRPQGVALVGAVLGAVAINGLRAPPFRRTLLVYRPLLAGLGVGIGAAVVAVAVGEDAPEASPAASSRDSSNPVGLLTWSSWTVAVFGLALGVVALVLYPFALGSLLRSPVERDRATGVALLTSTLALLLSVAAVSASPFGLDVLHERYLFYLTPLVLVGLAYCLETGRVLSGHALWIAGLGAIAVAASLPADQVARANNVDSPTAVWLNALHEELPGVPVRVLVVALAALGVIVLVLFRGRLAPFVAVAVAFTIGVGALDYSGALAPGRSGGSPGSIGRFPAPRRRRSCTSGTRDPTSPVELRRTTSSRASTSSRSSSTRASRRCSISGRRTSSATISRHLL